MKKIVLIGVFLIGVIIGWIIASYFASRNIEKIKAVYPPAWVNTVENTSSVMDGMTEEEVQETVDYVHEHSRRVYKESQARKLWQAMLAMQFQSALQQRDTNEINRLLTERFQAFRSSYADGNYEEDISKEIANALADRLIKEENRQQLPGEVRETSSRPSG